MNKKELITIRTANEKDINFIFATFLRGLYYGDSWFSEIPKTIFMENYHNALKRILVNPNNYVKIACLVEDPEIILAYAILSSDNKTLHWAFCKKAWRAIGLIKQLVPNTVTQVTHLTKVGLSIIKKRDHVIFNPFAV